METGSAEIVHLDQDVLTMPRSTWHLINRASTVEYNTPDLFNELLHPDILEDCTPIERYMCWLFVTYGEGISKVAKRICIDRMRAYDWWRDILDRGKE